MPAPDPAPPATRPSLRLSRWGAAGLTFLVVAVILFLRYDAPLPTPLTVDLTLDPGPGERSEPLLTAGRPQAGDFLFIRISGTETVRIGYETWGQPSRLSAPLPRPPDGRLRLVLEAPSLTQIRGVLAPRADRLRVTVNGQVAFDEVVPFYVRRPGEIFFAENPIGGTACSARLTGHLRLPDGAELRGAPRALHTPARSLSAWLFVSRWPVVLALGAGALAWVAWPRMVQAFRPGRKPAASMGAAIRPHAVFLAVSAACLASFSWMVSYGTFRLFGWEQFADFYEFQAASLLQGRLDVPEEAISAEAFVYGGKIYGYFGPTPALLRIPFVIAGWPYGELTRAFLVGYLAVSLLACYGLLRTLYRLVTGERVEPSGWAVVTLVGGAGAGSTLYFLGSRAYVYHEAILCGAMFALLAVWAALRQVEHPSGRAWIWALVAGVCSVHARPPVGLFALTFVGLIAALLTWRAARPQPGLARRYAVVAVLSIAGVLSFNGLSYLKFRTFEGCPLRYNVQYDAKRLARIDGRQFHLVNLPIAIDSYFVHANLRFERIFPYVYLGSRLTPRDWARTKIDYHDPTLGFPYAMPALFGLATVGGLAAFRRWRASRGLILAMWAAGVPMSLAMFAAIAITHRYTADFCPYLIASAALGLVGLDRSASRIRVWLAGAALLLTVLTVLLTFALTLHHQRAEVWGVPDKVRADYARFRGQPAG